MSQGTQRRLAAIVSADVVGYSRLMGADEVGTHARLKARFSELVEPAIARHGGRVVKLMGDGLLAEFPSVVDAALERCHRNDSRHAATLGAGGGICKRENSHGWELPIPPVDESPQLTRRAPKRAIPQ